MSEAKVDSVQFADPLFTIDLTGCAVVGRGAEAVVVAVEGNAAEVIKQKFFLNCFPAADGGDATNLLSL